MKGSAPMWSSWPWVRKIASDLALVLEQVGDVGDDDVDAQQFVVGKHDARIDNDDVAV